MGKDFYKILGLERNASDKDIKKAYKNLAIKYHPDKFANKSEKERKEAEDKFKEISEAYNVLSDPQKKANYDRFGTADGNPGPNFDDIFKNMGSFFGGGWNPFGNNMNHGNGWRSAQPGQSLQYDLELNIEDIFNGATKEIRYHRQVRCSKCNGEGGTGVKTCPHCNGTGQIVHTQRNGFATIQNITTCPHCNGTGKTIENICNDCNGKGLKPIVEHMTITVKPGTMHGTTMRYQGKGSESKDKNAPNGDLHILVTWNIDESKYRLGANGVDVYELINVPYYDCLLGKTIEKTLPNKEKINVIIPECSAEGNQIPIFGKGIGGRGNYIFVIKVQMPKTLTKDEKKIIEKLRK